MAKKKIYDIGIDDKSTPVLGKEKVKYYKSKDGSKKVKKKTFKAKGPKGYGVKKVKEKTKAKRTRRSDARASFRQPRSENGR